MYSHVEQWSALVESVSVCERVQSSNYFLTLSPDPLGLASVNTLVHGLNGPSHNVHVTLFRFE